VTERTGILPDKQVIVHSVQLMTEQLLAY